MRHSSDRKKRWEARATLLLKEKEAQQERASKAMEINWMVRGKRAAEDANENGNAGSGGAGAKTSPPARAAAIPVRGIRPLLQYLSFRLARPLGLI
jgi:hypothetical protein